MRFPEGGRRTLNSGRDAAVGEGLAAVEVRVAEQVRRGVVLDVSATCKRSRQGTASVVSRSLTFLTKLRFVAEARVEVQSSDGIVRGAATRAPPPQRKKR